MILKFSIKTKVFALYRKNLIEKYNRVDHPLFALCINVKANIRNCKFNFFCLLQQQVGNVLNIHSGNWNIKYYKAHIVNAKQINKPKYEAVNYIKNNIKCYAEFNRKHSSEVFKHTF